jgi:hypothetical protein
VVIDDNFFASKAHKENVHAVYDGKTCILYVNPGSWMWKDPSKKSRLGVAAVDGVDGTMAHEIGHHLHRLRDYEFFSNSSSLPLSEEARRVVGREVSDYACSNAAEFVAEVYSGMCFGKRYSEEVMKRYRWCRGPAPPLPPEIACGPPPRAR